MKRLVFAGFVLFAIATLVIVGIVIANQIQEVSRTTDVSQIDRDSEMETIQLPEPDLDGYLTLERAIRQRRSVRSFCKDEILPTHSVSQILWSAQGVTDSANEFRTVPSAGALYPLEIYLVAGHIDGLDAGVYQYDPLQNQLFKLKNGDRREDIYLAALSQSSILDAPASIIIAAVYQRTKDRYGRNAEKYVHMEAGHAGQNICLQVLSLEMATVPIGAFHEQDIKKAIGMPAGTTPLYIFPIGYPSE